MAWTEEQQAAIDSRGQNLLLSAAAGSGKTAVLVERIIGRLLDPDAPVEITDLLVMTFTRAAAQEMRTRIGSALAAAEARQPSLRIERQLALLGSAQISTVHSFCQQVLKQYFYRLDLDAGFRQGTETEISLWRQQALEDAMLAAYESDDAAFYRLADGFRKRNEDRALRKAVLRLYEYSRSLPFPQAWLESLAAAYEEPGSVEELTRPLWERWQTEAAQYAAQMHEAVRALQGYEELAPHAALLRAEAAALTAAASANSWEDVGAAVRGMVFPVWPRKKAEGMAAEAKQQAKAVRDSVKKWLDGWLQGVLATDPARWREDLRSTAAEVRSLVRLVEDYATRFAAYKKQERILDFSDLEHFCLALLLAPESTPERPVPSETARELAAKYAEVMVDEYQDTNAVQELIAQLVSRADNRFMVGDVKQSIYRFRLADPSIFLTKYARYARAASAPERRIDLARNFRSEANILAAVNHIFRRIMQPPLADLSYGDAEALYPGRTVQDAPANWVGGPVEVMLVPPAGTSPVSTEDVDEDAVAPDDLTAQAECLAARISALKAQGALVQEKDGRFRPLAWRDVVILLRSVKGRAEVLAECLRAHGIPVYAEQAGGYFAATEVRTLLALLTVIDNSRRDLALAATLRSPLVGWDENDLARLHLLQRETEGHLIDALPAWCESQRGTPQGARTQGFLVQLAAWRMLARRESVAALLRRIYDDSGYRAYVGGLPQGSVRQANLTALYDRARDFDESMGGGLSRFLRYFERLQAQEEDLAVPSVVGENEDVVRIMTIHKSKGLEFPVVFVANMQQGWNRQDLQERVLLHRREGLGMYRYDAAAGIAYPTIRYHVLKEILRRESLAEEQRLLYVAMTRARDKLYLVGTGEVDAEAQQRFLRPAAGSYLDWVMSALADHPDLVAFWEVPTENSGKPAEGHFRVLRGEMTETSRTTLAARPELAAVEAGEPTGRQLPDDLVRTLCFRYASEEATCIPAKVTVTEVTHGRVPVLRPQPPGYPLPARTAETDEEAMRYVRLLAAEGALTAEEEAAEPSVPSGEPEAAVLPEPPQFLSGDGEIRTGAQYGTLLHRVLELVRTDGLPGDGERLLDELHSRGLLSAEERERIPAAVLDRWFGSAIAAELRAAETALYECPFGLLLPAADVLPETATRDEVFLQGVIDCVFTHADGSLTILDYKTDRVAAPEILLSRYRRQLDLYAAAATRIWGRPVREKVIYSLALGEEIRWR